MRNIGRMLLPIVVSLICTVLLSSCLVAQHRLWSVEIVDPFDTAEIGVLTVGDSITGSTGCWRAELQRELRDAGYRDVNFLGRDAGPGCGGDFDTDNRGYSGARATQVARQGKLPDWMKSERRRTDIVLMQYGANDLRKGSSVDEVLRAHTDLVRQARRVNPEVTVVVGELIPMSATPMDKPCAHCPRDVAALRDQLPDWAREVDSPGSPVLLARHFAGFDVVDDTTDGLHPNETGNQKMAATWSGPLRRTIADR